MSDDEIDVQLTGPPEPVESDPPKMVLPSSDGSNANVVKLGTWICIQCGTEQYIPPHKGELDTPYQCEGCEREKPGYSHKGVAEDQDPNLHAYVGNGWMKPHGVSDEGYEELWDDLHDWVKKYWAYPEDWMYDGLAAYIITTWLRDEIDAVPQLMVIGKHDAGKTRLLNTLKHVSYRAKLPVDFTGPALFRTIDAFNTTMFLSEFHQLAQDQKEVAESVIKGSQKRGESVLRVEKNGSGEFTPKDFDIFTHVGFATQYEPADDIASRSIPIKTKTTDRDMPMEFDEDDAGQLRARLLYARYRLLESVEWDNAITGAKVLLTEEYGIVGRLREKLLAITAAGIVWDRAEELEPFIEYVKTEAEEEKAESDDALFIQALIDLAFEEVGIRKTLDDEISVDWQGVNILIGDVADRFNSMTGRDVSSSYIGQIRNRLDIDKSRKSDGTVIDDPDLREKLKRLAQENNVEFEPLNAHQIIRELDDDDTYRAKCSECGNLEQLEYRHAVEGHHMCAECADEYQAMSET